MRQCLFALLVVTTLLACRQRLEVGRLDGEGGSGEGGGGSGGGGPDPVDVARLTPRIAAGTASTCALDPSSRVVCWGDNQYGQLGSEMPSGSGTPLVVGGFADTPGGVYGGGLAQCATVGAELRPYCWGTGAIYGDFEGMFWAVTSYFPFEVPGAGSDVALLAMGTSFTCLLTTEGRAKCWGFGANGVLGNGGTSDSYFFVDVAGDARFLALDAATVGFHTCGVTATGGVMCWGANAHGQLGATGPDSPVPVAVPGVEGAIGVAVGRNHSCALGGDGAVRCWGQSTYLQLGGEAFAPVPDIPSMVAIDAGAEETCGRSAEGAIWCWGQNQESLPPQPPHLVVDASFGAVEHSQGAHHGCAINAVSQVTCWGAFGTLGPSTVFSL
ncbi:MAG: hypothetical protein KC731_08275 [Myxococcales bacterium]|nr:hypothetical protein [Myxococcales bacterium]